MKWIISLAIIIIPVICFPGKSTGQSVTTPNLVSTAYNWNSMIAVQTKTGEKRQVLNSPTSTLENLEIHVTSLKPGESAHPAHQHPEEELTIVKEGIVEVLVNGELKTVGPGSVIFQAANQLHSIKNVGKTIAVYHAIKWKSNKGTKG